MEWLVSSLFVCISILEGSADCGGFLTEPSGWISSPDSDNDSLYDNYAECMWIIEVYESQVIELKFLELDIEEELVCEYDNVKIRDGLTPMIHHCGTELPQDVVTDTRIAIVEFNSDGSIKRKGFKLTYQLIEDPTCGYRTWRNVGRFGSFDTTIKPGICTWAIQGPRIYVLLQVYVSKLGIQPNEGCEEEYIEVLRVDKFRRTIRIQTGEEEKDISPDMICSEKQGTSSTSETHCRKRVQKVRKTAHVPSDQATQTEMAAGSDNGPSNEVFIKMNENGVLIEDGEVFKIAGTGVSVGVTSVLDNDTATGSLVVGNSLMKEVSVTAPINKLAVAVSNLSRKDTASLKNSSLFVRREKLVTAPYPLRMSVRRALLGKILRKEIQSALRLTSFKKNFCLGVVSPEFDFDIFNFQADMKEEYSISRGNLSCLDSLMGKLWDVQSPSGNCNFVTRLTLKIKDQQLCGKVCFARCRQALPSDSRSYLSRYDVGSDAGQSDNCTF